MEELLVMAEMLISVLAPTGDKTTDTYLISKGEKGVELTFEDLRQLAKFYMRLGPLVSMLKDFSTNAEIRDYLWTMEGRADAAEEEAAQLRYVWEQKRQDLLAGEPVCVCGDDCPGDCKGQCGCQRCKQDYADFLSQE
jgi:hypothetical protein